MFANELSYFFTITISTFTTIITYSTFVYMKNTYICLSKKNKCIQTGVENVESETQTDIDNAMSCSSCSSCSNSFIKIEYIKNLEEDSLENMMLLANNQLLIQNKPSEYKWFF
jgi:hypothetical protein